MTGTDLAVWWTWGTGKSLGIFVVVFCFLGFGWYLFVCLFVLFVGFVLGGFLWFFGFFSIFLFESYAANSKKKTGKIF